MTLTLAGIRSRARLRLEEAAAAVWTDNEIDEATTATLEAYGEVWPKEATTTAAVSAGAVTATRPSGARDVVRVLLATGEVVPRRGAPSGKVSDELLAWEDFAGVLRFTQALDAQTLTIWYTAAPAIGDVPDDAASLLVAGAVWRCLQQRGVQSLKRRDGRDGQALIAEAHREYIELWSGRRRRVRQHTLTPG